MRASPAPPPSETMPVDNVRDSRAVSPAANKVVSFGRARIILRFQWDPSGSRAENYGVSFM